MTMSVPAMTAIQVVHNQKNNSTPTALVYLRGTHIQATVSDGNVTLTGEVPWNYVREDTAMVVKRVLGVMGVSNEIIVKPRVAANQVENKIAESSLATRHSTPGRSESRHRARRSF